MTELFTGRYRTFEAAMGVSVSITVGQPEWPLGYEVNRRIRRLAPFGLMNLEGAEFVAAYRAQLERLDVAELVERFEAISAGEDGRPLVLLCYEDVHAGQLCHRRVFADWFEERTGQRVLEIPATSSTRESGQLSLVIDEPKGSEGSRS